MLVLLCISETSRALFPHYIASIVDAISASDSIAIYFFYLLICLVIARLSKTLMGMLWGEFIPTIEADMRMSVYKYLNTHPHSYFANSYIGTITNKISDVPRSVNLIFDVLLFVLLPLLANVVVTLILFYLINFEIASIMALLIILYFVANVVCCRFILKNFAKHAQSRSTIQGKVTDSIINHLSVRLFAGHNYENDYLGRAQEVEQALHKKAIRFLELSRAIALENIHLGLFLAKCL